MVDIIIVACIIVLSVAFATSGFRDFFFWGRKNPHKFCEKCGSRVKQTADNYDAMHRSQFGHEHTYECKKCGHIQTAHCFTYS